MSIVDIIKAEFTANPASTQAENLRIAAWYIMDDYPEVTSSDFGDAAAICGFNRHSAINRWNEAKRNLEIANGDK